MADKRSYGTLRNINSTQGEEKHKPFKSAAPYTNPVNPDLQLLRRVSLLHSVRLIADGCIVESEYRWITDVLSDMQDTTPLLYRGLASVAPTSDPSEERLQSFNPLASALRVTNRTLTRDHTTTIEALAPALQSAYAKVGLTIGVVSGRLQFYGVASFTKEARRITIRPGMNIIHGNSRVPVQIDSIAVHERQSGSKAVFLMVKRWRQVSVDPLFDCDVLELTDNSGDLVPLTSVEYHIPHLVGCGDGNPGRSWWNRWDISFH